MHALPDFLTALLRSEETFQKSQKLWMCKRWCCDFCLGLSRKVCSVIWRREKGCGRPKHTDERPFFLDFAVRVPASAAGSRDREPVLENRTRRDDRPRWPREPNGHRGEAKNNSLNGFLSRLRTLLVSKNLPCNNLEFFFLFSLRSSFSSFVSFLLRPTSVLRMTMSLIRGPTPLHVLWPRYIVKRLLPSMTFP